MGKLAATVSESIVLALQRHPVEMIFGQRLRSAAGATRDALSVPQGAYRAAELSVALAKALKSGEFWLLDILTSPEAQAPLLLFAGSLE